MKKWCGIALALSVLIVPHAAAQIVAPLDVRSSAPILDHGVGAPLLPGTPPYATNFGCAYVPGCVVEILVIGSNNVAHLPNLDGTPSGGDTILDTTVIGDYNGLNPCFDQLDTAFTNRPANGTKIYARVFNATTVAAATYWGQSATFTVSNSAVFDVSVAGLKATTMPEGIDLNTIDAKGQTYYNELVANTNPQNPNDVFAAGVLPISGPQQFQVSVSGHSGRIYTLQRTTNDLANAVWSNIASNAMLSADTDLILADPNPPHTPKAFYRLQVTMP